MYILTKFVLSQTGRGYYCNENAWSIDKLLNYISTSIQRNNFDNSDKYLISVHEQILKELTLEDKNHITLTGTHDLFKPFETNKVMFVFAKILKVTQYKKDSITLYCNYVNDKGIFTGTFEVTKRIYDAMYIELEDERERYIFGTCIRVSKKTRPKTSYSSNSHRSYTIDSGKEYYINKLLTCSMINT